ncbi:MAG: hypothetical protein LBR23_01860 [Spirochaetaceae bacterium]|jgi:phage terminase small subunit|nr:hypothetical protein [Spirochaetaceae bacterium]
MTAKKTLFAEALLSGQTVTAAARQAGIGERTAYTWLKDGLRRFVETRRRELFEANVNRLQTSMTGAVGTLDEIASDKGNPAHARTSAAKALLEQAVKLYELQDIERRIAALEARNTPD